MGPRIRRTLTVLARTSAVFALFLGGGIPRAQAQSAFWSPSVTGGGSWTNPSNWLGGVVPSGSGNAAAFTLDFTPGASVTLDGDQVIGTILSTGANAWSLDPGTGGTLTVANITVTGGPLTVNAPLVGVNFVKDGSGTLTLSNPGSAFTGTININAGTLNLVGSANFSTTSNELHIGSGATLDATQLTGGLRYGGSPDTRTAIHDGDVLDGTGTVKGGLKVKSGGTVYPGDNGVGTLTSDGKTLFETGSNWTVKLGSANPGATNTSNRLVVSKDLTLQLSMKIIIDGSNQTFIAGQTYRYNIATADTLFLDPVTFIPTNFNIPVSLDDFILSKTAGDLFVNFTPVPEPGFLLAVGFGVAAGIRVLRRRTGDYHKLQIVSGSFP